MAKVVKGIVTVVVGLLYWLMYFLCVPTLSLAYFSGFSFISAGIILLALIVAMWLYKDEEYNLVVWWIPGGICLAVIIISLVIGIGSTALFHSDEMYHQIGEIEFKTFQNDVVEIDNSQIPIVDIKLASKLADKKLGEDLALGSMAQVGNFTNKQVVNGKLVYVAPLEHRSYFKWRKNKQGTTGYIVVSATNFNDVKLVQNVGGEDIHLKYLESACFSSDLKRHLRDSGFKTVAFGEFSFQLNEEGRPYWVVPTYKNTTLWRNPEVTGIIICDAQTGETEYYALDEISKCAWVDIVQDEDFIKNQLTNYGSLVHGPFNFSEKDELTVTPQITTVYNNGECYYYTGMSSSGADEGTVGFVMVNARDKSTVMYRMAGATESAAMRSAEGKVQHMGYNATTPIPLNVSGIPTYFCTLKDSEGLVKLYAFVNMQDYSIVETGSSIQEAKRAYINSVNNSSNSVVFSGDEAYGYEEEGIVNRIGSNIENGNTYYYIVLENHPERIFLASYAVSEELPLTSVGDTVKVSYVDENIEGVINIVSFDNMKFGLNEEQEINIIENDENNIVKVDPEANQKTWDSLTEEEKAELLENVN